jgi:putative nucleotidyltransferase with HDIG domain
MLAIGAPVAMDLWRDVPSHIITGELGPEELVAHEEALLGPQVRAIMVRLAEKDSSTERHTRRVALLAVRLGERLGLSAGRLRRLAVGAMLHDIGKLQVPDEILSKPAALTDDEFAVIRRHPAWGEQLAGELGFDRYTRRLIRSHHERLDGGGYPDGLGARSLDLDTRLLTVCDVYDALVSDRVYRPALSVDAALDLMFEDAVTAFDQECLHALAALVRAAGSVAATQLEADGRPAPLDDGVGVGVAPGRRDVNRR